MSKITTEVNQAQKNFFDMQFHAKKGRRRATLKELSKGLVHLSSALGLSYEEINDSYRNSENNIFIGLQCGWANHDFKKAEMLASAGRRDLALVHLSDGLVRVAEEIGQWHTRRD